MADHSPAAATTNANVDGRHQRSKSSRAKIIQALLDLVAAGDVTPSAARVADHAGVGLRTVFRHFDDMESLQREMSERIAAIVEPIAKRPFSGENWRDRILELAARRVDVFEVILPYRIAANLRRYQSGFMMEEYSRLLRIERQVLEALLPPERLADRVWLEALHVALGFQTWRVLRHDQNLPPAEAARVMRQLAEAQIALVDAST
jgi:AcrR family transcriptional regulator